MSGCSQPCDYEWPHPDHPCGVAGRIEDHPGTVMVDDLSHADVKGLLAGIGLSLRKDEP